MDKKRVDSLPALHPDRVKANLPSEAEMARQAEAASEICDDVKRRGAGGTKAGLVGIRPSGAKAYETFHEQFTSGKKQKPEEKKLIDLHNSKSKYKGPRVKVVALPETFCILCFKKDVAPPSQFCTSKTCSCCPMLNFQPILEPIANLVPGDIVRMVFCGNCKAEAKRDSKSEIQVMHEGQLVPLGVLKGFDRYKRVLANLRHILANASMEALNAEGDGLKVQGVGS